MGGVRAPIASVVTPQKSASAEPKVIRDITGKRDPLDPTAPVVTAPDPISPEAEKAIKDRINDPDWLAKDIAAREAGKLKAKQESTEKDKALFASGTQALMNKRVYDMARVRNRSKEYQAPVLGGDMTGSRKRLLGQ